MLFRSHVGAMLTFVFVSTAARAGVAVEIPRTIDGTLGSASTAPVVTALLVGASWRYLNPNKETSTWESKALAFDALGLVDITTMYAWGLRTVKAPWHVVRAGSAPTVDIDGVEYAITPCRASARTSCLVGPRP